VQPTGLAWLAWLRVSLVRMEDEPAPLKAPAGQPRNAVHRKNLPIRFAMCGHAWAICVVATRGRGVVATRGLNVRPGARARPMATCGLCLQRSLARAANSHAWATGGLQISAAWAMRGHKGRRTSGPAQRAFFKVGVSVPHTLCSAAWLGQGRVGVRWRTRATRGREGCAGLLSADKSHAWQKGLRRTTIGHVWPNYRTFCSSALFAW
jgi:hypothetical protein